MAAFVLLEIMLRRKRRTQKPQAKSSHGFNTFREKADGEGHSMKCRVCLKDGDIPIFKQVNIAEDIRKFGEIELSEEDKYPKSLCQECYGLLQAAVHFRQLAQDSDQSLRYPENQAEALYPNDVDIDDAVENNLNGVDEKDSNLHRCKKCHIDFNNAEEFVQHRRSEAHLKPRVQCPQCGVTIGKGSLKAHMIRLHSGLQPYMCDVCGKSFGMKGSFKRHLMIHTDELPFHCERCPYRCRYSASLAEHTRGHTGERPYACRQCPARFPNASNFRKHSHTHQTHTRFKCEHCHKGFHTMYKMRAHIKVDHMGLKEHVCDVCGKEFGYKEKLRQHQKNVHKRPKKRSGRLPLYLEIDEKLSRQRNVEPHEHPA